MQTIYPYLLYDDLSAAIDFLSRAFGFRETLRMDQHAELQLGEGKIMLGQPEHVNGTAMIYVYVDDVDTHFAQARDAGATIEHEPRDDGHGDRVYAARDPQGHAWYFAERRDD